MSGIKRISLEGLENTRDLGGIETADGRVIKPHRLIRSGQLYSAREVDLKKLTEEYELKTIVDFRTPVECREKPDPKISGVQYLENPILQEETLGLTRAEETDGGMTAMLERLVRQGTGNAEEYMNQTYRNLVLNPFAQKQYGRFFEILLEQEEGAVLWHCTAGKDRVGTGTVFLLSALGVPEETVIEDYLKTGEFTRKTVEKMALVAGQKTGSQKVMGEMKAFLGAKRSYADILLRTMKETCGGTQEYLKQALGVDQEKQERLRSMYLSDVIPPQGEAVFL